MNDSSSSSCHVFEPSQRRRNGRREPLASHTNTITRLVTVVIFNFYIIESTLSTGSVQHEGAAALNLHRGGSLPETVE